MTPVTFLGAALSFWAAAAVLAVVGCAPRLARVLLAAGCVSVAAACLLDLTSAQGLRGQLPSGLLGEHFALGGDGAWLLGFGALPAALATALGSPSGAWRAWVIGAAISLAGAVGCFVLQDTVSFLIAWECMSLGGAILLLGEALGPLSGGRPLLVMIGLLEVGAVALLAAVLLVSEKGMATTWAPISLSDARAGLAGLLCLVGFGAKLGILPFYEWYPRAYGMASGASATILSTIVLNAAFFGLERALTQWLPANEVMGVVLLVVGVATGILTALYAFQEDDWRRLLAFSSAENAAISVTLLGAADIFRANGLLPMASLALTVALLHMSGHALAKGGLLMAADGVFNASGTYHIGAAGILGRSQLAYGLGAVCCAMSLAAMPPTAGFVSEWYTFQSLFQGFRVPGLGARLALALAGAGMALTAALALATFIKIIGVGLLGRRVDDAPRGAPAAHVVAVMMSGAGVLILAIGMPWWLHALDGYARERWGMTGTAMQHGWLLVPLTEKFAFISPTMLVIVVPLLALFPLMLIRHAVRRHPIRHAPTWFGGLPAPERTRTTALTFSNAMRTFYRFIYRPAASVRPGEGESVYFTRHLRHHASVRPLFEHVSVAIPVRMVRAASRAVSPLQSGHMNVYLAMVGMLLVAIMVVSVL